MKEGEKNHGNEFSLEDITTALSEYKLPVRVEPSVVGRFIAGEHGSLYEFEPIKAAVDKLKYKRRTKNPNINL